MTTQALIRLPVREALARLRSGDLTAEAYARAFLARIVERDEAVRGWAWLDPQQVIEQARKLDAADVRGPLHGLPVAIKDVLQTADMPTAYNAPAYRDHRPGCDAAVVTQLRQAGALILGKTATVEFAAIGRPPATRNPHAPQRTPGGSSSGSAAVVADHQAPVAIGTQTGGSMIRPAGFCGAAAFKPSWGRVSTEGARRFAPTLDTIGWYGRAIDDLGILWSALAPGQPPSPAAPRRVGLCRTPYWDRAEPATHAAMDRARTALIAMGCVVEPLALPDEFADIADCQRTVMLAEGRVSFLAEAARDPGALSAPMLDMTSRPDDQRALIAAYDMAARARVWFDAQAARFDAVLAPSTVGEAPVGLIDTGDLIFNGLWTLLHTPVVHVPTGHGPAGLPVGVSLTGPRGADQSVLSAARALETALVGITPGE